MRIAQVIGTVTLNRCHPTFVGARLRLCVPLSLAELGGRESLAEDDSSDSKTTPAKDSRPLNPFTAEELVVWDDLGAGIGSRIALSEGAEAAQPFRPEVKPVDAYNAAILDSIEVVNDGR